MLKKKTLAIVMGTGRSGTNMMGRILARSEYIEAALEEEPIFSLALRVCRHPGDIDGLWPKIRDEYKRRVIDSDKVCFVDKTHQMLWFIDLIRRDLSKDFNVRFIMMRRRPLPVISSMLRHSSVRGHCENPQLFDHPNPFLGTVNPSLERQYTDFSIEERCALRWLSHKAKIDYEVKHHDSLCIDYENFVQCPNPYMRVLSAKLGVAIPLPQRVHAKSLGKWRQYLSDDQIKSIRRFIRCHRNEVKDAIKRL